MGGVAIDTRSQYAVSSSMDGMLRLWDTRTTCVRTLKGKWDDVKCMSVNWDSWQILSGAGGGSLKLWDVRTGRLVETLQGRGGIRQDVNCIAVDWGSRCALSGSAIGE